MNTENISTLKINVLTQEQYDREREAGRINPNELYLTPDEAMDLTAYLKKEEAASIYATKEELENKEVDISGIVTNIIDGAGEGAICSELNADAISKKSIAIGDSVTAGYKAYYIKYINIASKTIYLSNTQVTPALDTVAIQDEDKYFDTSFETPGYTQGVQFSIVNGSHYALCGSIAGIEKNKIKYDGNLGFASFASNPGSDDYTLWVPTQPDIGVVVFGDRTVAFGRGNKGSGSDSIVAGRDNIVAENYSAVFGRSNKVGYASFAAGRNNEATGLDSATIGHNNKATGEQAVAVNGGNEASGRSAFAEGNATKSKGHASHTEGIGTIAHGNAQHVQGKFNKEDELGRYAHILGSGADDDSRWNAHTVDWNGNAWFRGDVFVSGTDQDNSYKLVKQGEVDQSVSDGINDIYETLKLSSSIFEGTVFNGRCYHPSGLSKALSVTQVNDTNGIKFALMIPVNDNDGIYFSYWDKSNPITVKDGVVYFRLMMRSANVAETFIPTIKLIQPKDANGNTLANIAGQTEKLYTDANGWDNYLITVKCPNVVSFAHIYAFPAGEGVKMQNVGENACFDVAGWAIFDDFTKARTYDLTYSCSSFYLRGYNIQGQLDAKAPMYTYSTEDIQPGTPSSAPTGTLHFIYE